MKTTQPPKVGSDSITLTDRKGGVVIQLDRAPQWMRHAACADTTPELFFSSPTENGSTMAAKRACAGCPVAEQCLAYAMDNQITHGIWGGKSSKERHVIRRARDIALRAASCAAAS